MTQPILPLRDMETRHAGLTAAIATGNLEAATVCLDRHHAPPTVFLLDNGSPLEVNVEWTPADQRCRDAWNNVTDTTEAGAYACALAATELVEGLVAVRRAETGTGADYYVAPPGTDRTDFENCLRLEVSGTQAPDPLSLVRRLNRKLAQAEDGKSNLPAMAAVVGFACRQILMRRVP